MSHRFEYQPSILDEPEFVTAHEAGHVLLAYFHGHEIGPTRFFLFDGSFAGANSPISAVNEHMVDARAEQLLAGDLAARILAGLPTDLVSLPIESAECLGKWTSARKLASLLDRATRDRGHGEAKHDVSKVMDLVLKHRSDRLFWTRRWWHWFWKSVERTVAVLSSESGRLAHRALAAFYLECSFRSEAPIAGELSREVLENANAPRNSNGMMK